MTCRTASCSCGQLVATTRAEPIRVSICHCLACQRRTGSVFGAQARFDRSAVELHGESRRYVRTGDQGGTVTFDFCPNCGATVAFSVEAYPDSIAIPVGAFGDPAFPVPVLSMFEGRKHAWVALPDDVQHLP